MLTLRKWAAVTGLILMMSTQMTFAQGPLQKRVDYRINVEHALRMGDYVLPPGKYVLFQILQNDPNLFALYKKDLTHSPIAMIRTARIDYQSVRYPEKTKIYLTVEEAEKGRQDLPVLKGWTIPGMDGFEIVSIVEKKKGMLAHIQ